MAMYLKPSNDIPRFRCELVNTYPHRTDAFSQGIVFDDSDDFYYESTGLRGQSSVRKVALQSGEPTINHPLEPKLFGEGLTMFKNKIYQLTWQENVILIYDLELNLLETKTFDGEMWGLTHDENHLILSNGTSKIQFLDPDTLTVVKDAKIRMGRRDPGALNELEYAGGKLFANCHPTDSVYEIDLENEVVTGIIELDNLWKSADRPRDGVMNGLAFNKKRGNMFVTGKLCPSIYEVKFIPLY